MSANVRLRENAGTKLRRSFPLIFSAVVHKRPSVQTQNGVPWTVFGIAVSELVFPPGQVRGRVCRYAVCPHHPVAAAGERERGGRISGGQNDQPHETGSLHRHCEYDGSETDAALRRKNGKRSVLWKKTSAKHNTCHTHKNFE